MHACMYASIHVTFISRSSTSIELLLNSFKIMSGKRNRRAMAKLKESLSQKKHELLLVVIIITE